MLRIKIAASDAQGSVNEDAVGYQGDAAWVIDGATGLGANLLGGPSDAAWLATTANAFLKQVLADSPDLPTVDVLRRVMELCADALAREQVSPAEGPHELPSAAFAMVRVMDGMAEITTLADCRVAAVDREGSARLFGDSPALDAIEGRTLAAMRELLLAEPGLAPDILKARLMPGLRANRRLMNSLDGYWVLGVDPAAADHVWQVRVRLQPGARFAVASDGFLRLVELFRTLEPADLLSIATSQDWARRLRELRDLEREPGTLQRFARVKAHDDASLVVCEWEDTY